MQTEHQDSCHNDGTSRPSQPSAPDPHVRDHLANERTLLSWIRLGLAAAGLGFVVTRFGLLLRELGAPEHRTIPSAAGRLSALLWSCSARCW